MKSQKHQSIKESKSSNNLQNSPSSEQQQQQEEADFQETQDQQLPQQNLVGNNRLSFWDDLVKLVQLTIILVLVIFVFVMGYMIVYEVHLLWFKEKQIGLNKMDQIKLVDDNKVKSQNIVSNGESVQQNQDEQHELEAALIGDHNKQNQNHQQKKQIQIPAKSTDLQVKSHIRIQQKKQQGHKNIKSAQQFDIYDPVLIQLNKNRKRFGQKYKQTIYTMKNTSITQDQYLRSKNLIQIMNYYNAKQNKFIVNNNNKYKQLQIIDCDNNNDQCEKKQKYIDSIVGQQILYYEQKYKQSYKNTKVQLPFCIIIPSYKNNHNNNIHKNLNSILQQQYHNYHIVYIDDASNDNTSQVVQQYINHYHIQSNKLLLITNQQNHKALQNIYYAAHNHCNQKDIMIIIDGDDYLIGTQVLRFLNYQYQTKTLLAAYTNYLRVNDPYYIKVGTSTPYPKVVIDKKMFRKSPKMFRASHLRSYYVDLFRKIKKQDLMNENGQFFSAANDFAIMMPILQMASHHVQYLPEITYLYDAGTGLNNFQSKKQQQQKNVGIIAKRKPYNSVNWKQFYYIK